MSAPTTRTTTRTTTRNGRGTLDLAWRLVLVAVAGVAGAVQGPAWARTPLTVAAALACLTFLIRRRRGRGLLDAVLVGVGGAVIAVALLGLALNYLPGGLTALSWSVGIAILESAGLLVLFLLRKPAQPGLAAAGPFPRAGLAWGAAVLVVLAGALVLSIRSFSSTHVDPLALSLAYTDGRADVTVSSGTAGGPYELDLVTRSGRSVLARAISVEAGIAAVTQVDLPADTRGLVQLVPDGGGAPIRQLILDESMPSRTSRTTR